jgi:hypothetical protein
LQTNINKLRESTLFLYKKSSFLQEQEGHSHFLSIFGNCGTLPFCFREGYPLEAAAVDIHLQSTKEGENINGANHLKGYRKSTQLVAIHRVKGHEGSSRHQS